jgi:hypothetical protein
MLKYFKTKIYHSNFLKKKTITELTLLDVTITQLYSIQFYFISQVRHTT